MNGYRCDIWTLCDIQGLQDFHYNLGSIEEESAKWEVSARPSEQGNPDAFSQHRYKYTSLL